MTKQSLVITSLILLPLLGSGMTSTQSRNPELLAEVARLNQPANLASRCLPDSVSDKKLFSSDFRWGYNLAELIQRYTEIYSSEKRLPRRMYWDASLNSFVLPMIESWGASAQVPMLFVESVKMHVESALRLKYVDGIFFPDMGHSHFYVPASRWNAITDRPVNQTNKIYEAFFQEPSLKVLYHTAEQLQTRDPDGNPFKDRKTFWRFSSRNIWGDNLARGTLEILQTEPGTLEYKANTVGEVAGYARWGGGFNLSASSKGCYAFASEESVRFFDLSLFDLEPDPSSGTGGF